jgi:hypothetical protein
LKNLIPTKKINTTKNPILTQIFVENAFKAWLLAPKNANGTLNKKLKL